MAIVITESFEIPAHWLPFLIDCDISGIPESEALQLEAFYDGMLDQYSCFDVQLPQGEPYFTKYHAAHDYGMLACDVYEVDVIVDVQE